MPSRCESCYFRLIVFFFLHTEPLLSKTLIDNNRSVICCLYVQLNIRSEKKLASLGFHLTLLDGFAFKVGMVNFVGKPWSHESINAILTCTYHGRIFAAQPDIDSHQSKPLPYQLHQKIIAACEKIITYRKNNRNTMSSFTKKNNQPISVVIYF